MNKLDNIIGHLAQQEPELTGADALCDSILESLPEQEQPKSGLRIGIVRWTTGIAASLLLALSIPQMLEVEAPQETKQTTSYRVSYQQEYQELSQVTSLQEAMAQIAARKESRTSIYNIKKRLSL